jgi:hypothetical protein
MRCAVNAQVEQHQRERAIDLLQRLFTRIGDDRFPTEALEQTGQQLAVQLVVVDDEDLPDLLRHDHDVSDSPAWRNLCKRATIALKTCSVK